MMKIVPVSATNEEDFIAMPVSLYANDPHWIQPLNKDILEVFDKEKNKAFRFGTVNRWLLQNEGGKNIGRIAAFVNKKYKNKGDDGPVGGIGFFECINSQPAANLLFDTAKTWLQQQGMVAMDGPINFGERDKWWGLVVKGFHEPLYCMNYNPEYYAGLFENYGFRIFYNQVCFGMEPKSQLSEKIWQRHATFANNPSFHSEHLQKNNLEKYAADFATVYNKAWAGHGGLKEMSSQQVLMMFRQMKPVMNEKIVWFIYQNTEPIGIFVNLPDLNQWFKYLHGKFGLFQKLRFLWVKATKTNKKFTGLVFGIVPEWQGKGADAYIVGEAYRKYVGTPQSPYFEYEMQWIGDFNPKMINVAQGLGNVSETRRLCTFRYNFDREKEFKRHPFV